VSDAIVIPQYFFGFVILESRMRPEGNRLIGEGRSWHYDGQGALVKDSGWQPMGAVLYWPEPEPHRWWQFWK
jgi:pectin methylesterase-like acyl-CoA thioesterase